MAEMKASVLKASVLKAWAVVENGAPLREIVLPLPEPRGTEVLLEVTHCGVCHSDLHIWEGYYDLGGGERLSLAERGVKLPLAMGHEIVGRIRAAGPDAGVVPLGARRIVYPWVGCGVCARCRAEEDNMCATPASIGVFRHGGYASHVLVPHPRHLIDPLDLDPALAATFACAGITVYSAIAKVLPRPAEEPIVLDGAGGLGISAIGILRALGHRAIVVADLAAEKREAALAAGATAVVAAGEGMAARLVAACGGPAGAVIDFVNSSATAAAGYEALAKGGILVLVGLFGGGLTLKLPLVAMRALTVRGSYVGSPADLAALVRLAAEGRFAGPPLTRLPMAQAGAALMRLRDGAVTGRQVLVATDA